MYGLCSRAAYNGTCTVYHAWLQFENLHRVSVVRQTLDIALCLHFEKRGDSSTAAVAAAVRLVMIMKPVCQLKS